MDSWDIEELAYRAMGKTDAEAEEAINNGDIDEAVYDKYDCSFESYCAIVRDLVKFTPLVQSALTGTAFHAFVDSEQQRAIFKVDA
jgi:hypothetical protein